MAKLSVSIPDQLADELRDEAADNVSRFVASAVRDALDRQRLLRALAQLDTEIGPLDTEDLADADVEFAAVEAENRVLAASTVAKGSKKSTDSGRLRRRKG